MMDIYNLNIDTDNCEIFPKHIWTDPNIIFHGTSEYYSKEIEKEGFTKSFCPFSKEQANELINLLRIPEVAELYENQKIIKSIVNDIEQYIKSSNNNELRLSFSYCSYISSSFACGINKGGQIIGKISKCKNFVKNNIKLKKINPQLVTDQIAKLFQQVENISVASGVVYAIEINEPYEGIQEEYGVIHSNLTIPQNALIGKIILPEEYYIEENIFELSKIQNQKKLYAPNNLGTILFKKYYYGNKDFDT